MDPRGSRSESPRQAGTPVNALFAAILFGTLTALVEPPWSHIENATRGYLILTVAHFIPLFVLSLLARPGSIGQWGATVIAAVGSVGLCLHAGLSTAIVESIDASTMLSQTTLFAVSEIFLSTVAVPVGLLLVYGRPASGLLTYLWIPTATAVASQILWFGLVHAVQGASGIEFWFATRIFIHLGFGLTAGFFWAGARLFRPRPYPSHWGGATELLLSRLPRALPVSTVMACGLLLSGTLRIAAELNDKDRLITVRLDDYFLALTNMRRAREADLVYPALFADIERKRRALLGAAGFDTELVRRTRAMLNEIERESPRTTIFRNKVLAVNRRLMASGEPYFLEPHSMADGPGRLKFLFRYRIERMGRYALEGNGTVPMLRLRRLDDILIDTPYTGLSYPGLGTVLMDHIDDTVLRTYAQLFSPAALRRDSGQGRFAATGLLMRKDRRGSLEAALSGQLGPGKRSLEGLADFSDRWRYLADLSRIRAKMNVTTLTAFDALTEAIARQTEVHEARHAFDKDLPTTLPELEELAAGPLTYQAITEIRAYLTEIIDGPLGPRFGLSTLAKMIMGPDARANAYFFASVVILEGLWGEKVRRPDIVDRKSQGGLKAVVVPITTAHPGWLSYSRIHGAYADLSALASPEIRRRAIDLFERLFDEDYTRVKRRR